jgi:hypothetical protein
LGDRAAGAHNSAGADADRCHQRRVGADERAGANLGPVLGNAVMVAGDGEGGKQESLPHIGLFEEEQDF